MNARHPDYSNTPHIDPGDPPLSRYANPDPINAWRPGSVEEQRAHFRPNPRVHVTQAEMGPMPTAVELVDAYEAKAKPEREGPDYTNAEADDTPTIRINVGIPTRERTMRIIRGPATGALLEFLRMQQAYQDTDEALGAQGQFAEIFHDTAKLKRMIWDRRNPQSASVGEVGETLMSLIGHALLAMDHMEKGNKDGR